MPEQPRDATESHALESRRSTVSCVEDVGTMEGRAVRCIRGFERSCPVGWSLVVLLSRRLLCFFHVGRSSYSKLKKAKQQRSRGSRERGTDQDQGRE